MARNTWRCLTHGRRFCWALVLESEHDGSTDGLWSLTWVAAVFFSTNATIAVEWHAILFCVCSGFAFLKRLPSSILYNIWIKLKCILEVYCREIKFESKSLQICNTVMAKNAVKLHKLFCSYVVKLTTDYCCSLSKRLVLLRDHLFVTAICYWDLSCVDFDCFTTVVALFQTLLQRTVYSITNSHESRLYTSSLLQNGKLNLGRFSCTRGWCQNIPSIHLLFRNMIPFVSSKCHNEL